MSQCVRLSRVSLALPCTAHYVHTCTPPKSSPFSRSPPMQISPDETTFIKEALKSGTRMDGRKLTEMRNQQIRKDPSNASPLSDGAVKITRGQSELIVSVVIKGRDEVVPGSAGSTGSASSKGGRAPSSTSPDTISLSMHDLRLDSTFFTTFTSKAIFSCPPWMVIHNFLIPYGVGCLIDMTIVNDDGNLFDMLFDAVKEIFQSVQVPVLTDLSRTVTDGVAVPWCRSYAVIGGVVVADPTGVEEAAAEGTVRLFEGGQLVGEGVAVDKKIREQLSC